MSARDHPLKSVFLPGLTLALLAAAPGCEQRVLSTSYGEMGSGVHAAPEQGSGGFPDADTDAGRDEEGRWAVVLGRFEGPDHQLQAERRRRRLTQATGMGKMWVDNEERTSTLYHGRYASSRAPAARSDLRRLQALARAGRIRVPVLMLTPLSPSIGGENAGDDKKNNLRNAPGEGVYTMQIGYFDRKYGEDYRRAAQRLVRRLREKGEEAYYYHGPNRTSITIGVFPESSVRLNPSTGLSELSDAMEAVRREYPRNIVNGGRDRSESEKTQPSRPVRIPR